MGKKPGLDLNRLEQEWAKFWEKEKIYCFDIACKKPLYSIDTPPPTVSGSMHLGHAFAYAQQDIVARYKRMKGYNVFHPFGFDDNGLATERFVEKARKIRAKDFSREEFIKICLEETKKAEAELKKDFSGLGMSVDWENLLYRTIDGNSRKISQKSFIDIYGKGRAYRKEAPIMWCPKCETAIAQAELEDVEMDSAFNDILFEVDGEKITIATTRPELLPACVAVFVNPADERHKNLVGKKAKVPLFGHEVPVIADARADPEKGTGIVMCCTFGDQTDMEWYKAHNLPLRIAITPDGRMNGKAKGYEGTKLKEARKKIIEDLNGKGLLTGQKAIKHAVNVHERCKTEIEFIVSKQWFIKYLDLKKEFINRANEIEWMPKHMKARYDNWIQGLQWDWCVSRQRFFGVPIPVWYCRGCGEVVLAGEGQLPVDPLKDKPAASACGRCGGNEFEPEKDVFDTWATSSLTPQINAMWGIDDARFKKVYPMDLRPQGHDIITLWAFNTIVKGLLHHGRLPWKNIMINGWALDPKGKKMSKSLGNVVHPREIMEKYSADVLRYWASGANLGEDVPYQEKEMVAGRKFAVKLYNASKFVSQLTEGFDMGKAEPEKPEFKAADRWILSRLNEVKKNADSSLENYRLSKALAEIRNFFWLEFADYYIEEVKYRLYSEKDEAADAAKFSLLSVMIDVLKMLAPFMPHLAEEVWQRRFGGYAKEKSIHLEEWPEVDESRIDGYYDRLGEVMNLVIGAVRKTKSEKGISLNAGVNEVTVFLESESLAKMIGEVSEEIRKTMNITSLNVVNAAPPPDAISLGKELSARVSI